MKEIRVKAMIAVIAAAWLTCGCVSGSTIPHDDSPAVTNRDAGPALCRDGSTPPCNNRD